MPSPPSTLPEYFVERALSAEKYPVLAFPSRPDKPAGLKYYTNQDIHELVLKVASHYQGLGIASAPQVDTVVGLSAPGTVAWLATFIAFNRMGYTVLALSPNLSSEALAGLIEKSNCKILITDLTLEKETWANRIKTVPMIFYCALSASPSPPPTLLLSSLSAPAPAIAYITHSSGSTGLPKLFLIPQATAIARLGSFQSSVYGQRTSFISSALHNSAGFSLALGALSKPVPSFYWNDRLPWSGPGLLEFLAEAKPDIVTLVPAALEMIVNVPGGLGLLQQIPSVNNFGALCPQEVGDAAVRAGVRFSTGYAMSEAGTLLNSVGRPMHDLDWDYMSPLPVVEGYLWMKPLSGETEGEHETLFEAVLLKGFPNCPPSLSNSDDPAGSFHTGDAFRRHRAKLDRWKIVGRMDDQINMGIPVAVNAVEYEILIKIAAANLVGEAVLFGQGRKRLGVLVFPKDGVESEDARDAVWRTIAEKVNGNMKMGIEKDMIVVTRGTVPRTDKGNFKRAAVYLKYQQLIDGAYDGEAEKSSRL